MRKRYKTLIIVTVLQVFISHFAFGGCTLRDSISTSKNAICYGDSNGSATVGVKGGTKPYKYSWAPYGGTNATASHLVSQIYTVTVTDSNGCIATSTINIFSDPQQVISITYTAPSCLTCCDGSASATYSGGVAPWCCQSWSNGQKGFNDTALCAGTYTFCVLDGDGCEACDSVKIPTGPTAIEVISVSPAKCLVYPNPGNRVFTFSLGISNKKMQVEIYNMLGEKIYQATLIATDTKLDLGIQPQGIYLYHIITGSGEFLSGGEFIIE
jgi:type IX secretion system substrate protein/SprB-like repeat protein